LADLLDGIPVVVLVFPGKLTLDCLRVNYSGVFPSVTLGPFAQIVPYPF